MNLDEIYKWLNESPRNRKLEVLIFLACFMFAMQFWLIDQINSRRKRG